MVPSRFVIPLTIRALMLMSQAGPLFLTCPPVNHPKMLQGIDLRISSMFLMIWYFFRIPQKTQATLKRELFLRGCCRSGLSAALKGACQPRSNVWCRIISASSHTETPRTTGPIFPNSTQSRFTPHQCTGAATVDTDITDTATNLKAN